MMRVIQMTLLNCLTNGDSSLVIDTSVVINLNGTQFFEEIIKALSARFVMTEIAYGELAPEYNDVKLTSDLVENELLQVMPLCSESEDIFLNLVSGHAAQTLGDGEAATIAFAHVIDSIAVVDEKKATNLCKKNYPSLRLVSTIDILAHPNVMNSIGEKNLAEAIYNALKTARMRIAPEQMQWVLKIIGLEKALKCTSIPQITKQRLKKMLV